MKEYVVELSAKYYVKFPDEQKVIDYFIDGDWKNTFYTFHDLDDLCEHIIMGFHQESSQWDRDKKTYFKFIEGFYPFYNNVNSNDWTSTDEESRAVIIISEEEELDIEYCQEREE